jgi:glycosyltransferase involved in cell wall biosynthesis
MSTTKIGGWTAARSQGAMIPGSVLFHAPAHVFQSPGGGENQLVQTGRHLEDLGLSVRLFSPWLDRIEEARVVHLFGMSRDGLELAQVARARGVSVVLSPICWIEPKAMAAQAPNALRKAWLRTAWNAKRFVPRWPSWRRSLLNAVDAVLPNSLAEATQLVRLFGADVKRIQVVPNGVQSIFTHASPERFRDEFGFDEFVLYVGRIEPRKNVLGLIDAIVGTGFPLVVIGAAPAGHERYADACRAAGRGFVRWLDPIEHDDPRLASAYAAARVFALASWFETPGLAALEAALAGCAVVITPYGCTREYFGERVEYARPDRPREIARAITRAWELGADPRLASSIGSRFLWSDVAQRTAEVYDQIAG